MTDTKLEAPLIQTAIPKRRYQLGAFSGVVLGEIESGDGIEYHYLLAMVEDGAAQPQFYVSAERNRGAAAKRGIFRMRVMAPWGTEVLGDSDRWRDLDAFLTDAFSIVMAQLALTDETPVRVM